MTTPPSPATLSREEIWEGVRTITLSQGSYQPAVLVQADDLHFVELRIIGAPADTVARPIPGPMTPQGMNKTGYAFGRATRIPVDSIQALHLLGTIFFTRNADGVLLPLMQPGDAESDERRQALALLSLPVRDGEPDPDAEPVLSLAEQIEDASGQLVDLLLLPEGQALGETAEVLVTFLAGMAKAEAERVVRQPARGWRLWGGRGRKGKP